MRNLDIRMIVSNNGLRYRDIAKELDITPEWLSRLLRYELTTDNKIRIMRAIDQLMREKS